MLIPIKELQEKYNPKFTGVIHVGGHFGEEFSDYLNVGIIDQVWIEPCINSFNVLRENIGSKNGVLLFNCACGENDGVGKMNVSPSNEGQSNSLLPPHKHLTQHPSVLFTETEYVLIKRLDDLPFNQSNYNFLAMDVQGYEGHVLKGADFTLQFTDYIYAEVNRDSTYMGNMLIEEIDELLSDFQRVETKWASANLSWGDAFYIRKTKMKR